MTKLFDIRLWMYPGANPDSSASTWGTEEDISDYVRQPGQDGGAAITYSGGKGDEAPQPDAGQMSLTLDNRDGRFSTDNAAGPWYGELDIATPVRLGVASFVDAFTRTTSNGWGSVNASLGQTWTHTGTLANWSTDGAKGNVIIPAANSAVLADAGNGGGRDADVTLTVIPAAVATGGRFACGITLRRAAVNTYVIGTLGFDLAGALKLDIVRRVSGVDTGLAGTITLGATYSAGQRWRLRMQADGGEVRIKAWAEAGTEPDTWDLTAAETVATGTGMGLYMARFSGNSNSGASSILGVDDFQVIGLEFTGSFVSLPVRWDKRGNNSWAPVTAAGILRRLTQGTFPIQSPLRRQLGATADVSGYWPLEDGAAADSFSSTIPGQQAATFQDVTPAADTSLPGGGPAPTLTSATGSIVGRTVIPQNGTGFSCMFLIKLPSVPVSKTLIARIRCSRGTGRRWDISVEAALMHTEVYTDDGTLASSASTGLPPLDWTNWIAVQLETDNSGASTAWSTLSHEVGKTDYWSQTGSVSGTLNTLITSCVLSGPSGTAFAHLWMGQNTLPFVDDTFSLVSSGYAGETAAARFARVCTEAGLPFMVLPGDSERMGPQKEGGTLAVLRSCVEADYGVMSERGAGLEFIPRTARWNATAGMAVSMAAGEIDDPPEPVRDDLKLRNKWTVSRTSGGQGVFQDDASIAKQGTWEDSVTINTYTDAVLESHAAWRTYIGTQGRMRWPGVSFNLARNRHLVPLWRNRTYGWRFTMDLSLDQVTGNEPDLIMEGFSVRLWERGWEVDVNATNASVWVAGVTDDTGILGRADNEYCETTALISATATTIPITTTSGLRWDNTAGLWTGGVDFWVGGERVTVTSITNNVDPAQTLNVSARGVGGYAASHASGTKVRLWSPAIVAL
jgi:hypothetical protein